MNRKSSSTHERGISLLDIILAILLISIIGAGSVPSLRAMLYADELGRQTRLLKFRLQTALTDALIKQQDIAAIFGGTWYKITPEPPNPELTFNLPISMTALLKSKKGQTINFYRSGVATPATIEIKEKNKKCLLTLSLRGRIEEQC